MASDIDKKCRGTFWIVVAIMLLGVFVRGYSLDEHSMWFDEHAGVAYFDESEGLLSCLDEQFENRESPPLYFVILYYVNKCFEPSLLALRWLSVVFGVLAIPLMYLVATRVAGRTAGLVTALWLALSPIHIIHSQGLRPYPLMFLAALLSVYTFLRVIHNDGHPWWLLNILANTVLVWTHFFGCWLLFAE
ncbi:MAG TPA: phospholipid carrier-dependent glycosyltransferase, partial [Candidatus Hydrogenedentes bacterium]|nr:phospholipid carrier-dependent glycosyltransferase [Candidatus Hydrogenedentota bacterium]